MLSSPWGWLWGCWCCGRLRELRSALPVHTLLLGEQSSLRSCFRHRNRQLVGPAVVAASAFLAEHKRRSPQTRTRGWISCSPFLTQARGSRAVLSGRQ